MVIFIDGRSLEQTNDRRGLKVKTELRSEVIKSRVEAQWEPRAFSPREADVSLSVNLLTEVVVLTEA